MEICTNMKKLSELFNQYGSDKCCGHRYGEFYDQFQVENPDCKSILEIGVHKGASCLAMAECFPNAVISGIDINPLFVSTSDRILIHKFDVLDAHSCSVICDWLAPWDLIIDDASHSISDILTTVHYFLSRCRGTYVIEDVQSDADLLRLLETPHSRCMDFRSSSNLKDDVLVIIDCVMNK